MPVLDSGRTYAHYEINAVLGQGATGVVYEAYDVHRGRTVALKQLTTPSAARTSRLKHEFRRLSAIRHPNVVKLYELLEVDGTWAIAMERVRGASIAGLAAEPTLPVGDVVEPAASTGPSADVARVLDAFGQLHAALSTLHAHGCLHLDLHPGNVLCEPEGRVVLLDFGLVTDIAARATGAAHRFSAPELTAEPATPAADWYGFGVLLTLALAPLSKSPEHEALEALATELTRASPADRPDGDDVGRRLTGGRASSAPRLSGVSTMVGRVSERARLQRALGAARSGRMALARVVGEGGLGKSRLVDEVLRQRTAMLVLRGACRPSDGARYSGLDELVETLATVVEDADHEVLDGRAAGALGVMFPALARSGATVPPSFDAEARASATLGLSQLLAAVARRVPLAIVLEDLHWAGPDTLSALGEVLSRQVPGAAVIVTHRPSRFVDDALAPFCATTTSREYAGIVLGPLGHDDALALAAAVAPHRDPHDLAAAAGGSPSLVRELADAPRALTLTARVHETLSASAPAERSIAVSVAFGAEVSRELLVAISGSSREQLVPLLLRLEAHRLVRSDGVGTAERIVPWSDAVGDAIRASLPEHEHASEHATIVRGLRAVAPHDAARIAEHARRAGDVARAVAPALVAAREAESALAFDRAISFLDVAIDGTDPEDRRQLELRRIEALVSAGRTGEAGRDLARLAPLDAALWAPASEHLVASGALDEGREALRSASSRLGLPVPTSASHAVLSALPKLFRLALGGGAAGVPIDLSRQRVDLAISAARGLLAVDSATGAHYALVALWHARASEDPARHCRALLVVGAGVLGALDGPLGSWGRSMVDEAAAIAEASGDPVLVGFTEVARCQAAIYRGAWAAAIEHGERAAELLRTQRRGLTWELAMAAMGVIRAVEERGDLPGAAVRTEELMRASRRHGDRYGITTAALYGAFQAFHRGDVRGALEQTQSAIDGWSGGGYTLQHFYADRVGVHAALDRDASAAVLLAEACARRVTAAGLASVPVVGIDLLLMNARVGLSVAVNGHSTHRARAASRALRRHIRPDAAVHAMAIDAAVRWIEGDPAGAADLAARASERFERLGMRTAAVVTEAAIPRGSLERRAALDHLATLEVSDPERWTAVMLPTGSARPARWTARRASLA